MAERIRTQSRLEARLSRRDFFKMAAIGTASIPAGILLTNELGRLNGIETEQGIFYPLYENHTIGINSSEIPSDINIFFREYPYPSVFDLESFLSQRSKNFATFKDGVLENLAKKNVEIMVGDIQDPDYNESLRHGLVYGLGGISVIQAIKLNRTIKILQENQKTSGVKRRKILKYFLYGIGAWGLSPTLTAIAQAAFISNHQPEVKILGSRISGLLSHLHPEDSTIFFRNLIMADKLMTVAQNYTKENGRKPKIAFNVGAGHAGMEDFLELGPTVIRHLILNHPNTYLMSAIEKNGGLDHLCSSLLIRLPSEFIEHNKDPLNLVENVEQRFVTDEILKEAIAYKIENPSFSI